LKTIRDFFLRKTEKAMQERAERSRELKEISKKISKISNDLDFIRDELGTKKKKAGKT